MKQGLRTRSPAIRECCVLSEFSARENDSGSCDVNETGRQRDFFFTRAEFMLSTFIEPPNDLRSSVRNSYVRLNTSCRNTTRREIVVFGGHANCMKIIGVSDGAMSIRVVVHVSAWWCTLCTRFQSEQNLAEIS
jgi:hypothetical protein